MNNSLNHSRPEAKASKNYVSGRRKNSTPNCIQGWVVSFPMLSDSIFWVGANNNQNRQYFITWETDSALNELYLDGVQAQKVGNYCYRMGVR